MDGVYTLPPLSPVFYNMTLTEYLKKYRIDRCEFAEMCGVHRTALSSYLGGKMSFGKKRALMISTATKGRVSIQEVMFPKDIQEYKE